MNVIVSFPDGTDENLTVTWVYVLHTNPVTITCRVGVVAPPTQQMYVADMYFSLDDQGQCVVLPRESSSTVLGPPGTRGPGAPPVEGKLGAAAVPLRSGQADVTEEDHRPTW